MGGGGKGGSAPDAPNYYAIAKQQGKENRKTAEQITRSNRPTQYDAYGNMLSWTEGPNGSWTQRVMLGDTSQQSLDRFLANQRYAGDRFGTMLRNFNFNAPGAVTQAGGVPEYDASRGDTGYIDQWSITF